MKALISDIHANYAALRAVLADAEAMGCDEYICLGDVAGYHADINECIALLRSLPRLSLIRGNHDAYLLSGSGCPRSELVSRTLAYQAAVITPDNLAWLATSQEQLRCGLDLFVHGGPENCLEQYIYRVTPSLCRDGLQRLFCGHTHVQVLYSQERLLFCNPGSVGQPRDGIPQAAYAVLGPSGVQLKRVEYDIAATEHSMKSAGFPDFYYANLRMGAQVGGRIDQIFLEGF
ncbi:MAG: metallophosphoesterase family protein [Cyanobium sp.]|jgi:predicted phosphodiesterase